MEEKGLPRATAGEQAGWSHSGERVGMSGGSRVKERLPPSLALPRPRTADEVT